MSNIDLTTRIADVDISQPVEFTQTTGPSVASYPYPQWPRTEDPRIQALESRCAELENRVRELEERLSGIA